MPPADKTLAAFREAMDDDFNTAAAIGHLSEAFLLANKLLDEPRRRGQGRPPPDAGAAARGSRRLRRDAGDLPAPAGRVPARPTALRLCARRGIDPAAVEARIAERAAARKAKDFARADELRRALQEIGVELMDTPAGTTWRVVEPR